MYAIRSYYARLLKRYALDVIAVIPTDLHDHMADTVVGAVIQNGFFLKDWFPEFAEMAQHQVQRKAITVILRNNFV